MMISNASFIATTTCIPILRQAGCEQNNQKNIELKWSKNSFQSMPHPAYPAFGLPGSLPALPMDVLQADWWVPGSTSRSEHSKFVGKALFKEILTPTMITCSLWLSRATEDNGSDKTRLGKVSLKYTI